MKKKALILVVTLLIIVQGAWAQKATTVHRRINCMGNYVETRGKANKSQPQPFAFDPQTTYRQPVVLITFNDADFSMDDPAAYYDRLFNELGYNEGEGLGCVADYFREQSNGLVNLQFDIYGPVKIDEKAKSSFESNYGDTAMRKAIKKLCETEETDFSIYDWDGDGEVNQVLFIAASYSGNMLDGYIWPNSSFFYTKLPGDIYPYFYSISTELWEDDSRCGIGTIIHEFLHCLGLPDIYPLGDATNFSTVDEWDLMDGGNYTNNGWCPPNLTAMEKMYLGWKTPIELTEATTIEGMKPLSDNGETYIVRSSGNADEFYILENRRQEGWDYGCPGNGLLIYHVDFDEDEWRDNQVNISNDHYRYNLFHADGKDFLAWSPDNDCSDPSRYTMDGYMRSSYFSTSPYPYTDPITLTINAALTDDSTPAATLFTANADGQLMMSKAITNIRMADDGTISFDFMKTDTGIRDASRLNDNGKMINDDGRTINDNGGWHTLDGRKINTKPTAKGLYIYNGKKQIVK